MLGAGQAQPQVVLITGASRGIGAACARLLAEGGHRLFGTSRQAPGGSSATTLGHGSLELLLMDVDSDDSVAAGVGHVLDRAGRLDVAVNNAGMGILGSVEDTSAAEAGPSWRPTCWGRGASAGPCCRRCAPRAAG